MPHYVQIPDEAIQKVIDSFRPTAGVMEAVGFFMVQQVKDRFASQGASSGQPWAPKRMKSWGHDDGRAILTGHTGHLLESFQSSGTANEAVVFSELPYSKVHQLGTVGKGGTLPTIRPKKAKALFIPITDRAHNSQRHEGENAQMIRWAHNAKATKSPYRTATRGKKMKNLPGVFEPLVRGRLHNGRLQKIDERTGDYVDGVPDFIFLTKVDIAPRPMLPDSPQEIEATTQFLADVLLEG